MQKKLFAEILTEINEFLNPAEDDDDVTHPDFINITDIPVKFDKPYLIDSDDVEKYLTTLKSNLLDELKNKKRIIV